MRHRLALSIGKFVKTLIHLLGLGAGGTWPGEVTLKLSPQIMSFLAKRLTKGLIIVAGTNGKTTTARMLMTILARKGEKIVYNESGANLLNGIVSAFIQRADWLGRVRADWAIIEVDENSLPLALKYVTPRAVVLLNLFRDQLDRYGEVDVIAQKWERALRRLPHNTQLILNADDPQIAHLGSHVQADVSYFGLTDKTHYLKQREHATDSIFCLSCGARLAYAGVYFSHLGDWKCKSCGAARPKIDLSEWVYPLAGVYNRYNTLAAVLTAKLLVIPINHIKQALTGFTPAFGRQETFEIDGKTIKLFLSKNPVGFNESLKTVIDLGATNLLLVLNDRIPDGRDVSWIWDVDFEQLPKNVSIIVGGDRVFDLALRLKYSRNMSEDIVIKENLSEAIKEGLKQIKTSETLYILPTYSAMLATRKIVSGRKIL